MISKKAVAIPYIIALIIGVIVVAVLAYWFITSGGKGIDIGKDAECLARETEYCAIQSIDAESMATKVCPSDWKTNIEDFCGRIIPGWKKVS